MVDVVFRVALEGVGGGGWSGVLGEFVDGGIGCEQSEQVGILFVDSAPFMVNFWHRLVL